MSMPTHIMNGASFVSLSNDYHPVPQLVLVTSRDLLSCLHGAMTKTHLLLDFLSTLNCRMVACRRTACHRAAWRSSPGMANKLGSNKETNTLGKENKSKCKCAMTPMSNMHHNLPDTCPYNHCKIAQQKQYTCLHKPNVLSLIHI